ncbi:MAG: DUF3078 domain-containing protein [Bacteroidaceae bacterium]|nr:DUF3078 domain-containing protein [Bacteroidaceae bacterium]MDO4956151.1 DUF3078 domain-containing protein [Bacteroidales bacterium]
MIKRYLVLFAASFLLLPASAQYRNATQNTDSVVTAYMDSLRMATNRYRTTSSNGELNPYLYKLTTTPTYYNDAVHQAFDIDANADKANADMNRFLMNGYLNSPSLFTSSEAQFTVPAVKVETPQAEVPKIEVAKLVEVEKPQGDISGDIDPIAAKPNFWKYKANVYFQFSQSYVSANWYKGGESSNNMLTGLTLEANYDDQERVEWENKLEFKLGFISSRADSIHKYKTNNDLLRLSTKMGYKAVKNWYYTAMAELENQLFHGYKSNDTRTYSAFLAPMKFNASLGMDFKKKKDKSYEISLMILPASFNYIYVGNKNVDVTLFGIDADKRHMSKIGSKLQLDHTLFFTQNISWKSHFFVFTSYHTTESLWENTFDFIVNKYLSAKIYINARFDDAAKRHHDYGYFQMNESLSFGLSYNL